MVGYGGAAAQLEICSTARAANLQAHTPASLLSQSAYYRTNDHDEILYLKLSILVLSEILHHETPSSRLGAALQLALPSRRAIAVTLMAPVTS
jgi:hypothetical protein